MDKTASIRQDEVPTTGDVLTVLDEMMLEVRRQMAQRAVQLMAEGLPAEEAARCGFRTYRGHAEEILNTASRLMAGYPPPPPPPGPR